MQWLLWAFDCLCLNSSLPNLVRRERIDLNFYFHSSWCLKRFCAFKAVIKPFEAPRRSMKIKIKVNFYSNTTLKCMRGESLICYKTRFDKCMLLTKKFREFSVNAVRWFIYISIHSFRWFIWFLQRKNISAMEPWQYLLNLNNRSQITLLMYTLIILKCLLMEIIIS